MKNCLVFIPIFLISLSLTCAQQLIDLKTFRGGNVKNDINAPAPYDVFVSATSDDSDLLDQIHLVTKDGQYMTLYELKSRKPFHMTGQIQPFPVQTSAYIRTNLTDDQMNALTGMMFVSTTKQLQVNNFHVTDIDKAQNLYLSSTENQTFVFLNSNMETTPFQSTTISFWNQSSDASIYIYQGIPTDLPEENNTFIFSNPVMTTKYGKVFIPNVEKFSLSMGAFYIKSFNGANFQIEPEYYDADKSITHAFTTTGFYMKSINQKDRTTTIYTATDPAYNGTIGANIIGSLPDGGEVTVGENDGLSFSKTTVTPTDQIMGWSTNTIGQNFQISSINGLAGEYFVQYYVIQGPRKTDYTTPSSIQTTTNNSNSFKFSVTFSMTFLITFAFY